VAPLAEARWEVGVDAEVHLHSVTSAADRAGEQPQHIPQAPRLVLAQHAGRDG